MWLYDVSHLKYCKLVRNIMKLNIGMDKLNKRANIFGNLFVLYQFHQLKHVYEARNKTSCKYK